MMCSCLLLLAMVLASVLLSGYYYDDIPNSLTFETVRSTYHGSLSEMIRDINFKWMTDLGRLFPISIASGYTAFYYLAWDPFYIKLLNVSLILLVSLSACRFVYHLTSSGSTALLVLLLLTITIQTRYGFDPVLAFSSLHLGTSLWSL
jgi:hypothetical protein